MKSYKKTLNFLLKINLILKIDRANFEIETIVYFQWKLFDEVATVNLLKSNAIFIPRYLNIFVCACKPTEPCQDLEGKHCFRDEECGEGGFCSPPG